MSDVCVCGHLAQSHDDAELLGPGRCHSPCCFGSALGRTYGAGTKGGDIDRFPERLQLREFPAAAVPA